MSRLIIVANRLPITAHMDGAGVVVAPSTGGLATGLRGPHERSNGMWIGWPGELPRLNGTQQRALEARLSEFRLIPVYLRRREVKSFYEDVANAVLWPVFHSQIDQLTNAFAGWDAFRAVNAKFARAVAERGEPGDQVWVHDYQLVLVPAMLRELVPDGRIGFFLHIPFPSDDILSLLPWSEDILRGILGADLVGFHTYAYLRNFCDALQRVLGLDAALDAPVAPESRSRNSSVQALTGPGSTASGRSWLGHVNVAGELVWHLPRFTEEVGPRNICDDEPAPPRNDTQMLGGNKGFVPLVSEASQHRPGIRPDGDPGNGTELAKLLERLSHPAFSLFMLVGVIGTVGVERQ